MARLAVWSGRCDRLCAIKGPARARSVQRHPRLSEERIGFPLQRTDHRSDAMPGHQPATATRLPHAAGALQDVSEVLRATDRHHAPEFGELDRADAGGQGGGERKGPQLMGGAVANRSPSHY